MLRCRMASLAPLQEVQQEIKAVLEKVSELETSLAAASRLEMTMRLGSYVTGWCSWTGKGLYYVKRRTSSWLYNQEVSTVCHVRTRI